MILGFLLKARSHKYIRRIRIGSKWRYFYTEAEYKEYKETVEKEAGRQENYINEKPSDIQNVGEDMLGAKRHNFDTYDVEQLEKSGMASKVVKKANLLGDYQLDEDRRKENGETPGKIASAYAVKDKLISAPPDSPEARKKYSQFCRIIERADTESKTARDFLSKLRQLSGIKPKSELAQEEADKKGEQFSRWGYGAGWKEAEERKTASEKVVGQRLVKFMDNDFARIEGGRWKSDALTSWDETDKDVKASELLARHSITPKGEVKIKKDDSVKIKDMSGTLVRGKFDSDMYQKNKDEIQRVREELDKIPLRDLSDAEKKRYNTLREKWYSLQGRGYLKITNIGVVQKVSQGKYHVAVMDERGGPHLMKLSKDQIELEHSAEVGGRRKKGKPNLQLEGKVARSGGTSVEGLSGLEAQAKLGKDGNMKGLQYGNSMTDDEREYHTKWTLASFMDLADVTGISFADISMDGKLGMAFGARGKSGALAHYEPGTKVINLTRHNGYGSLAHEWGHFLDNVSSNVSNGKNDMGMASNGNYPRKRLEVTSREQLPHGAIVENTKGERYYYDPEKGGRYPFYRLRKGEMVPSGGANYSIPDYALKSYNVTTTDPSDVSSKFEVIAKKAYEGMKDNLKDFGGYWSRREELLARSFEAYVADKLESMGRVNTYLASKSKTKDLEAELVYPQGKLREELNKDFDELFSALRNSKMLKKARDYFNMDPNILRKIELRDKVRGVL